MTLARCKTTVADPWTGPVALVPELNRMEKKPKLLRLNCCDKAVYSLGINGTSAS